MFDVARIERSYRGSSQDRIDVIQHPLGLVVAVADGAGGISGGEEAADTAILWARAHVTSPHDITSADQWSELLSRVDRQINSANGESTVVIAAISDSGIAGASVGDSVAWMIDENGCDDLTANQVRKPLLGSGAAKPVPFTRAAMSGTLLLASDGLVNYAPRQRICEVARMPDLHDAAEALVNLVRLRSGALQDDIAIILCRRAESRGQPHTGRKRYTLMADGEMLEEDGDGDQGAAHE